MEEPINSLLIRYDLTSKMAPYLDVHMILPLIEFQRREVPIAIYGQVDLILLKISTTMRTNMLESVEDDFEKLPNDLPAKVEFLKNNKSWEERKAAIFHKLDSEPVSFETINTFFEDTAKVTELKKDGNLTLDYLSTTLGITSEDLEMYYKSSKLKYDCGMYDDAEVMLENFLSILQIQNSMLLSALWGRLSCHILQAKWENTPQDLTAVKEAIESRSLSPMDQIKQRSSLMHWGIFVFINQKDGTDALVDLFSEKIYLQTIENMCPWLLRYYAVSVILSTRKRSMIKEVMLELQSMSYLYSDPITEFLEYLYEQFDFDGAQKRLRICAAIMANDFFLSPYTERFVSAARLLICEIYCTINSRVDISVLAAKLEMSEEEAEKWMVDIVCGATTQTTTLDARIDSSGKQVIMSVPMRNSRHLVVEKTRDLTVRTSMMSANLEGVVEAHAVYAKIR